MTDLGLILLSLLLRTVSEGYFSVAVRNVTGYVRTDNRERGRKKAWKQTV